MKYSKILFFFLLLTLFIDASTSRAIYRKTYGNENKVALVIGNSNYTHFSTLKNTLNDAEDIQQVLKDKGFDVLYLKDGDLRSMKKIVRQFSLKLRKGGVGFFYYAGHGLEVNGQNYLVPVKADIPDKTEVEFETLAVNMIINKMEDSHNRLNIIVLDACRNDPFSNSRAIGGGGLAQINNARGMYIAFATAPGETASDGSSGRNGLFTKHLIGHISQKNLTLNEVFKKTRVSVYTESREKQLPWTSSSVIGDFYFQLEETSQTSTPVSSPAPTNISQFEKEELLELRRIKQQKAEAERAELLKLREELSKKKLEEASIKKTRESYITPPTVHSNNYTTENSYSYQNSKSQNFPYVCYSAKFYTTNNKPIYSGCVRSNKACGSIGKEHFGKYPNDSKAHSAFKRCTKGKPKPNSSPKGLYVCYSDKFITHTNNVIYEGCNRSEIQCNKLGKLHFGKYNSNAKASSALNRCRQGNPKFTDSQGL